MRIRALTLCLFLLLILVASEARRRSRKYQMKMKRLKLRMREKRSINSDYFVSANHGPKWSQNNEHELTETGAVHDLIQLHSKQEDLMPPRVHQFPIDNTGQNRDPLENKYDLSNHGSLDKMFDIGQVNPNFKDSSPSSKSNYNNNKHDAVEERYDAFTHDQVFVPKNTIQVGESYKRPAIEFGSKTQSLKAIDENISCKKDNKPQSNSKPQTLPIYGGIVERIQSKGQRLFLQNVLATDQFSAEDATKKTKGRQGKNLNDYSQNLEYNKLSDAILGGSKDSKKSSSLLRVSTAESDHLRSKVAEEETQQRNSFENQILNDILNRDEASNSIKVVDFGDLSLRSFVFNPNAQSVEVFQKCVTPRNESGNCRYVQHCMLPTILSSVQHFVENACIIQRRFIGVCCPDFPVLSEFVKWPSGMTNFSVEESVPVTVPEDCGVATNPRIVGGTNADRKAWPWMVALLDNKKRFFCGGSLISDRYVLTAAHCTFGSSRSQIMARLGEYDFTELRDSHDDYLVVEIKRHGQYTRLTLRNDIALLKLEKPVVFNEFVRTICLPEPNRDYIGEIATLVGWGHLDGATRQSSDVLQEANFPIIPNSQCSTSHGVPVSPVLICAAAATEDKSACNGDSGGPLMLLDSDGRWKVIGIVSWGRRGCNPRFPTVYTRVNHYLKWIEKHST